MANAVLSMLLTAEDHASAVFRKVGGAAGDTERRQSRLAMVSGRLKTAMIGLGAAAGASAVYFAVDSVRAYADAEQSQMKLQAAYDRFPKLANASIDSLRSMNLSMQAKTKYDDDDLALMQSRLAAYDLSGKQLRRLTPMIADYATATGKDVVSAGESFGKALLGNTRALKAIGINYKMTGNRAKDFANITELVRSKVKGLAEREGQTAAGKLKILGNQFEEVKETVGAALVPALGELADWMGRNMPQIKASVASAMPGIKKAFETAGDVIQKVGSIVGTVWDKFSSAPQGVQDAIKTLGALGIVLGGLKKLGAFSGVKIAVDAGKALTGGGTTGVMNIRAGVVNVNGGKVTGGPGGGPGGGGGPTSRMPGWLGGVGLGAISGAFASAALGAGVAALVYKALDNTWKVSTVEGTKRWMASVRRSHLGDGSQRGMGPGTHPDSDRWYTGGNRRGTGGVRGVQDESKAQERLNQVLAEGAIRVRAAAAMTRGYAKSVDMVTPGTKRATAGIVGNTRAAVQNRLSLNRQAISGKALVSVMKSNGATAGQVGRAQVDMQRRFLQSAKSMGLNRSEAMRLGRSMGVVSKENRQFSHAQDKVNSTIKKGVGSVKNAAKASIDYAKSVEKIGPDSRRATAGIDGTSKAAQRNRASLRGQAAASKDLIKSLRDTGASSRTVASAQQKAGKQFLATAKSMGVPRKEARELGRALGVIPKSKSTKVSAPGAKDSKRGIDDHNRSADKVPSKKDTRMDAPNARRAQGDIEGVTSAANKVPGGATVSISTNAADAARAIYGVGDAARAVDGIVSTVTTITKNVIQNITETFKRAQGGPIYGPGTATSDSIPAWLSNGEFVMQTAAVNHYGPGMMHAINAMQFAGGGAADLRAMVRGKPWADDRWMDYNPVPSYPAEPKRGSKPNRRGKESKKEYKARLKEWRRTQNEKHDEWAQAKRDIKRDWQDRIHQEDLDWKWQKIDDRAEAKQRQKERDAEKKERDKEKAREAARAAAEKARERREALKQAREDKIGEIGQGLSTIKQYASVTGFDLNAAAQAQEELRTAREAVNVAGTPAERAQALNAVKAAQAKVAETAPTPANVTARMRKLLTQSRAFVGVLKSLRARGLNATTLSEIAGMDPESGLQLAKAIDGKALKDINLLQKGILQTGAQFGDVARTAQHGADRQARAVLTQIVDRGGVSTRVQVQANLYLDGRVIHQSLLKAKRRNGGAPLGLN